jgi:hypothetical protein
MDPLDRLEQEYQEAALDGALLAMARMEYGMEGLARRSVVAAGAFAELGRHLEEGYRREFDEIAFAEIAGDALAEAHRRHRAEISAMHREYARRQGARRRRG